MLIAVALPFACGSNRESGGFWDAPEGRALLAERLLALGRLDGDKVAVCADPGFELPPDSGWRLARVNPQDMERAHGIPGLSQALLAAQAMAANSDQAILVLNPANPLLDAALVRQAARAFEACGAPAMVSTRPMRDHPVQWRVYAEQLGAGMVHFLEGGAGNGGVRSTRPFAFDWSLEVRPPAVGESAVAEYVLLQRRWRPASDSGESEPVQVRVAEAAARLLVPSRVAGLGPEGYDAGGGEVWIEISGQDDDRPLASVVGAEGDDRPLLLRGAPFDEQGLDLESAFEVRFRAQDGPARLPLSINKATGFVYQLMTVVEDGTYDAELPFCPPHAPWVLAPNGRDRLDAETGLVIGGRQQFPAVLEADGALFATRAGLAGGGWRDPVRLASFELEDRQSMIIANEVDYLRYLAMTETGDIHGEGA